MSNFNYTKAWFLFCKPEWNNLKGDTVKFHQQVAGLVENHNQEGKDLLIPYPKTVVKDLAGSIPTEDLAKLSRLSHCIGHWCPRYMDTPFANKKGQSWKVSNVIDQILRDRLDPLPHNIQIHKGVLRVTFSSRDCWIWEEFGLATEDNLNTFNNCGLSFGERTIENSTKKLAKLIDDLWPARS